jgi:serine/threonine protein kinase
VHSESWFIVEVILAEYLARQQAGQKVYPSELFLRFPQWADDLRRELENRGLVDSTARGRRRPDTGTGTPGGGIEAPPPLVEMGPYELLRELGQGGVGRVFQVRDLGLGRVVALKVLRSGPVAGSDEVARFQREARMAAQLDHPHLMPVYSIGLFQGQYAITMPYLGGGNLLQHRAQYHDVRSAVVLMLEVCRAVAVAHRAGIVHRDLKPGNILLDEAGEPMVSDFGLARFTDSESEMTRPGQVLGTPGYMSPEQAGGRGPEVGPASDVWSLGVILYFLLTGRKPFEAPDNWQLFQKLRWSNPPLPRTLRQDIPADLETVLLKCLEKAPRNRYAHAGELADDLEHWLRGEPVSASRPRLRWLRPGSRSWPLVAGGVLGCLFLALSTVLNPTQARNAAADVSRLAPAPETPAQARATAGLAQPKRTPEEIQKDLLDRQLPVTLLGPTGKPDVFRWLNGERSIKTELFKEIPLTWDCPGWTMMELVRRVPWTRYRLSAEVRLRERRGTGVTTVGVYLLHQPRQVQAGGEDLMLHCGFSDLGRPPLLSRQFALSLHRSQEKFRDLSTLAWQPWPGDPPLAPRDEQWHTIAVEVTPGKIRASLDENLVLEEQSADLEAQARELYNRRGGGIPLPLLEGGVGLFLFQGTASFRNVVLMPLQQP